MRTSAELRTGDASPVEPPASVKPYPLMSFTSKNPAQAGQSRNGPREPLMAIAIGPAREGVTTRY